MRKTHNHEIAGLCYERFNRNKRYFVTIGRLYHGGTRSWSCVRIESLEEVVPNEYFVANLLPNIEDPPYIEGDIFLKKTKVGHIHTRQTETGKETQYYGQLTEVPAERFLRVVMEDR